LNNLNLSGVGMYFGFSFPWHAIWIKIRGSSEVTEGDPFSSKLLNSDCAFKLRDINLISLSKQQDW